PAPTQTADLTFEAFVERWRTNPPRSTVAETLKANDLAICNRLGQLIVDERKLAEWPIGLITEDTIENVFGQLQGFAGSTWNKYRDVVRLMQRWGVKKGYLLRPWISDDNEIVRHKETARRERRLVADVLDEKSGKLQEAGEERRLLQHATPW